MIIVKNLKLLNERKLLWRRVIEIAIFAIFYFVSFNYLESRDGDVFIFHNKLDEIIPFVPVFIIPYVLWFAYMAISVVYFFVMDLEGDDYWRMTRSLAFGCVVFLIFSFVCPNGQDLRPTELGDGFFERIIDTLYSGDTSTNVFPSLHCYNSIAACEAWLHAKRFKNNHILRAFIVVLTVSIVLSTMFLKQHSSWDVLGAIVLYVICWLLMEYMNRKKNTKAEEKGNS